ncbi:hypothetical protein FOZ63_010186, partial [Perkinsus olseni]
WRLEDPSAAAADVDQRGPNNSRGLSPESIHQSLLADHHPASGAWAMFDPLTSIYPNTTSLDDTGSVDEPFETLHRDTVGRLVRAKSGDCPKEVVAAVLARTPQLANPILPLLMPREETMQPQQ